MEDLYDRCGGRSWTKSDGWKRRAYWHGVTVEKRHVVKLELGDNGLVGGAFDVGCGVWRREWGRRRAAFVLWDQREPRGRHQYTVSHPPVSNERPDFAELPESIGKLTSLTTLSVWNNQLTGEFPRTFLAPSKHDLARSGWSSIPNERNTRPECIVESTG